MGIGRESTEQGSIRDPEVSDFREHYTVYAYYSPKKHYGNVKDFVDFLKSKGI